ncbi:Bug family tripartite tricarboxylate transporter substrate binding protein [Neoroseomonas oryzicola]|uniref:Tripartite tricarboxylate transporter substrate binding protein n=1 Tax=Neoroseomonas oryzicola TaxID=535904 RepID=A0A9X9WKJ6_9PROT|nr:tripartite tricarboxylate transporter substrate binding protein [Neoroseomonas oryzicola]MBR0660856.1 tripartite tricarboxylate transporter substrate binding protein [Neoroseomonas oryzicola]NKE19892.1 tripartite tricarboxylate transporter substrate binding protein [Neoroseomonas oryzicola]
MITRRTLGTAALTAIAAPALAQWQPTRPIRIFVGFAPGGGTDITTRTISARMQGLLGQPIVVENRPGAGGNLASEATVNAPSDGTTLMMGTIASLVMNPIMTRLPFDVLTDLTAIGRSVEVTNFLVVAPEKPWRTLAELVAAAKARPGTLSYGSSGVGGAGHLGGALLDSMAGIETIHVPYRGGGQLITDILSGKVDFSIATAATVLPHIEAGRLRALAVPFARRSALLPDVPTVAEAANLPGYEVANWYAMMGPRALPRPIVDRVNAAMNEAMRDPDVASNLAKHGLEPAPSTPEELTGFIRAETAKWRPIIERAGANAN